MKYNTLQWWIYLVKFLTRATPWGPNSFNLMQFLGKIWQNRMWAHPRRVGTPTLRKSWICHSIENFY